MQSFSSDDLNRIRDEFYRRGESVAAWSRRQGFDPNMVYQVLSGRCLARRGTSHRIAIALGLKQTQGWDSSDERALTGKESPM